MKSGGARSRGKAQNQLFTSNNLRHGLQNRRAPPLELRARVYIRVPASVARFPRSKRREGELRTVSLLGGGEIEDGTSYHVWWTPSFSLPSRLYIRTLPTVHFFPSLSITYRRVITRREHAPRILLLLGLGQPIWIIGNGRIAKREIAASDTKVIFQWNRRK